MSGPIVRRLRLPPADTSPAVARRAVSSLVDEAGLDELRSEALLLTSELVTNGVIHAGTDIEVEIIAVADGLRVAVTDFATPDPSLVAAEVALAPEADRRRGNGSGRPEPDGHEPDGQGQAGQGAEPGGRGGDGGTHPAVYARLDGALPGEGGRGLLLVSRFASRWGTSHEADGRQVWFQLDRQPGRPMTSPTVEVGDGPSVEAAIEVVLGRSPGSAGPSGSAGPVTLSELVNRLARAIGAATATVSVDRGDGRGPQTLARYSSTASLAPGGRAVRVPLPLSRPWTGEFTATGARARIAEPVAALTAGQLGLLVENQRLHEAHSDGRGWLLFLAQAGELLAQSMNVDLTVALIPRLLVPRLGQWCAVHLANEYGELTLASITHADETAVAALSDLLERQTDLLDNVLSGEVVGPLGTSTDSMSFPLIVRGERLGVLTAGRPTDRPHTPDELAIIEDLGRRAAVAIENARIHGNRSRIATTLQRSLLPPALPRIDGLEVAAQYVPAGDGLDVGGDFYDVVPLPRQSWMLVVGDVSGKGAGAAAVTGLVREVLHTLVADHREPGDTLSRLNATLVERGGGYFCTLALAFLTAAGPATFDLSLHLAGHEQPVLLSTDGVTSLVGRCGTALGLLEDIIVPRTTIQLRQGDSLVFYTDGVTERRKGSRLFGHQRLRTEISSLAGSPASVLASRLRRSVLDFSAQPPRDDIAIVALRAV